MDLLNDMKLLCENTEKFNGAEHELTRIAREFVMIVENFIHNQENVGSMDHRITNSNLRWSKDIWKRGRQSRGKGTTSFSLLGVTCIVFALFYKQIALFQQLIKRLYQRCVIMEYRKNGTYY